MFAFRYLVICTFLFGAALSRSPNVRQAKSFREPYTTTVVHEREHTEVIPSSCVLVEPTLPPCRTLRFLNFPALWGGNNNNQTKQNQTEESPQRSEPGVEETALSWGEYLGIYRPTITTTETRIVTTTVQDPSIVVTYSVMGCRPLSLPDHLERCPVEAINNNFAPSQIIPGFQPTVMPTPSIPVAVTAIPHFGQPIYPSNGQVSPDISPSNDIHDLSSSIDEHHFDNTNKPTSTLP